MAQYRVRRGKRTGHLGQRLQAHCSCPTCEKLQESQARAGCSASIREAARLLSRLRQVSSAWSTQFFVAIPSVTDSLASFGWQTPLLIFVHLCPVVLHIRAHMSPLNEASRHILPQLTVVTPAKTLFPKSDHICRHLG